MHKEKSLKAIKEMPPQERHQLACMKLSNVDGSGAISALLEHMRAHENTQWLIYKSDLSAQIPRSYAAHAFKELQKSVFHYELMRLCTFWDAIDLDSRSIPTIVALADCPDVSSSVYDNHFLQYQSYDLNRASAWGKTGRNRLRRGIRQARRIEDSDELRNVKNLRDKLAHQLEKTHAEKSSTVPNMRYGDERKLLKKTVTVVNNLYLSLNGTSFDWSGSKQMHARNAEAFWRGVEIKILR